MSNDSGLDLLEFFDGIVALLDILRDRETEPVVVLNTLAHDAVQSADLVGQQTLLDRLQVH